MTAIDLTGLHILITRPSAQALPWANKLMHLGAKTSCQAMLEIYPLIDDAPKQAAKNKVMSLDDYSKIIFVSQNAVNHGLAEIDNYWPQLPSNIDFFAVGASTAQLLAERLDDFGASVNFPKHAMNSEALLALDSLKGIAGDKILIVRGCGGRTHLGHTLEARGALVDYCEAYERKMPIAIDTEVLAHFKKSGLIPVISVHSGETLHNLCQLIQTHTNSATLHWMQQTALLLPGLRVAEIAKDLAFKQIIVAENATHEGMIEALYDWRR
ncbi:MAG: uroporphyrinogen-III synthase [Cellvibrionaceae bacterium]|jgi:uroporphyrinogen-III synthase